MVEETERGKERCSEERSHDKTLFQPPGFSSTPLLRPKYPDQVPNDFIDQGRQFPVNKIDPLNGGRRILQKMVPEDPGKKLSDDFVEFPRAQPEDK